MSLSIQIEIDPSKVVSGAAVATSALEKTGVAGEKAGAAATRGMDGAATATAAAAKAAKTMADQMAQLELAAKGYAGIADPLQREIDMLQRIRGPMGEYETGMQTINALLAKNAISSSEYAAQVDHLNHSLSSAHPSYGPTFDPGQAGHAAEGAGSAIGADALMAVGGAAGPAGAALASFATSGAGAAAAGLALAAAMVSLYTGLVDVGDRYVELTNRVTRYASASKSANDIVDDQLAIGGKLHSSLAATNNLFGTVREGVDGLGYSIDQTNRLTQDLGEAALESGKSIDSAAGVAQKLSFAMENGTVSTRDLRSIMREMPALTDALTAGLGKTTVQLMDMAKRGTLDAGTVTDALLRMSGSLDAGMSQRVETTGDAWQHLKDQVTVAVGKLVETSGIIPMITSGMQSLGHALDAVGPKLEAIGKQGAEAVSNLAGALSHLPGPIGDVFTKETDAEAAQRTYNESVVAFTKAYLGVPAAAAQAAAATQKFKTTIDDALAASVGVASNGQLTTYFQKMHDDAAIATDQVALLNGVLLQLQIRSAGLAARPPSAAEQLSGTNTRLADQFSGRNASFDDQYLVEQRKRDDAERAAAAQGKSYGPVAEELTKKETEHARAIADVTAAYKNHLITGREFGDQLTALNDQDLARWQGEVTHAVKAVTDAFITGRSSAAAYGTAIARIDAGAGPFSAQRKILSDVHTPMAEYIRQTQALAELQAGPAKLSASQYDEEIHKIMDSTIGPGVAASVKRDIAAYDIAIKRAEQYREMTKYGISSPASNGDFGNTEDNQLANGAAVGDLIAAKQNDASDAKAAATNEKVILGLMNENATAADKYKDALAALNVNRGMLDDDHYATYLQNLKDRLTTIRTPAEDFALAQKRLNEQMATGLPSLEAYDDAMRKLREQYGQGTFADGVTDGLKAIKTQIMDISSTVKTDMVSAFDAVNTTIVDGLMGTTIDWQKLLQGAERQLLNLALKQGESAIVKSVMGGVSDAAGPSAGIAAASATGSAEFATSIATSAATGAAEFATSMVAAGSQVAAMLAGAMATGGATSAGLGAAASVPAFAAEIPGGATAAAEDAAVALVYHRQPSSSVGGGAVQSTGSARDAPARSGDVHAHFHADADTLMNTLERSPRYNQSVTAKVIRTRGALRSRR